MTEEKTLRRLMGDVGLTREEAEARLVDEDLWLVDPARRWAFEGEEGVRQWETAYAFARALAEGFADPPSPAINEATVQLLWDLRDRAEVALRRARSRTSRAAGDRE